MGNHHSQNTNKLGLNTPRAGSRHGLAPRGSNPGSEAEAPAKTKLASFIPLEKLCKKEDGVNGITEKSIRKYLFPSYPEMGRQFYRYVHRVAQCKDAHIPTSVFEEQCDRLLSLIDASDIIDTYIRMFASDEDENVVTAEGYRSLLHTSYKLSMDHYPEGPQACMLINQTLSAVVNGCFNSQSSHSIGFVVRWLSVHCHRLIFPLHRYCVHVLASGHRESSPSGSESTESGKTGIELATPVLERGRKGASALLPLSAAWLLAAAAPPLYSRPVHAPPQIKGVGPRAWLASLVRVGPARWVPLYNSREHGMGANRFLHHTLSYRGPTMVLLQAQELLLVLCAPQEWKESHQYWGNTDAALIQVQPTFAVAEIAPKMLYLNTSIRGYPKGLRAGTDPRKPLLIVPEDFDMLFFKAAPYHLTSIEVWGCGEQSSRETQLEKKKSQFQDPEPHRTVKVSVADWMDHPDRYLLELGGRPQYND